MNNFEKNVDFINFFFKVNNTIQYKYTKRFNRLKKNDSLIGFLIIS